jgi:hypothetical protein
MAHRSVLALLAAQAGGLRAQAAPTCSDDLAAARGKVEANYGGFRLEVVGRRKADFERAYAGFEARARHSDGDCFGVLNAFAEWFDDPHLFIYQTVRLDSAESARRAAGVRMAPVSEEAARAYFMSHASRLDPIEGIWQDGDLRLAVVPDSALGRNHFVAVVLRPDTTTWRAGAVRATIARRADRTYDIDLSGRNYVLWHRHAHLHRGLLLRLDPGMWGRAFPVPAADSGTLDPADPHRPTLVAREGAVVVSMPSHDPAYKPVLDSLLAANADLIRRTDLLVVDLRGNEGGSSYTAAGLAPYIMSRDRRPSPLARRHAVMLSSPDQIAYARVAFGPDTSVFVRSLVARLAASPGQFVPLDTASTGDDDDDIPVAEGPRRVGVLIDRGTVSAAEIAVEFALRSTRATVFGQPTAGALDYEQVNIVNLSPAERRWFLGYPTITRDLSLPKGGIRGKGLQPDVRVDWGRVADPIGFAIGKLRACRAVRAPCA